jgi:hypothetical protein
MARLTAEIVLFRKMFSDKKPVDMTVKEFLIGDDHDWEKLSNEKMKSKPLVKKRKASVKQADKKAKLVFAAFFGAPQMAE